MRTSWQKPIRHDMKAPAGARAAELAAERAAEAAGDITRAARAHMESRMPPRQVLGNGR